MRIPPGLLLCRPQSALLQRPHQLRLSSATKAKEVNDLSQREDTTPLIWHEDTSEEISLAVGTSSSTCTVGGS